jgi:integrase
MRTWSADELRAFLASVRADFLYPLWLLAATTGMRRGEIAGLIWPNVDLDAARLSVRRTVVSVGYQAEWSEPKTDRGRRSVALDPFTVESLREHRARQPEQRLLLGIDVPHELVFAREDGSTLHPERISKIFDQHVRRSSLPRIRFHDLRHTYATLALQAGVHPKVVSERLGHADIALTLNVYSPRDSGSSRDGGSARRFPDRRPSCAFAV